MKQLIWILFLLSTVSACNAESPSPDNKPLMQDVWNKALRKAAQGANAFKNYGKPRVIPKGAKPEIIVKGNEIFINGTSVAIGQPIDKWKNALPKTAICRGQVRQVCKWDLLGIEVSTQSLSNTAVFDVIFYFNLEQHESWTYATERPDGTPATPPIDYRPKHPFPGYFELDGYGIDAKTEFWEIRARADPYRELRCGSHDCSHPHGAFSDKETLYLRLNKATDRGTLYELTISGHEESWSTEVKPK